MSQFDSKLYVEIPLQSVDRKAMINSISHTKPLVPVKPSISLRNKDTTDTGHVNCKPDGPSSAQGATCRRGSNGFNISRVVSMYDGPSLIGADKDEIQITIKKAYKNDAGDSRRKSDQCSKKNEPNYKNVCPISNTEKNECNLKEAKKDDIIKTSRASMIVKEMHYDNVNKVKEEDLAVNYITEKYATLGKISWDVDSLQHSSTSQILENMHKTENRPETSDLRSDLTEMVISSDRKKFERRSETILQMNSHSLKKDLENVPKDTVSDENSNRVLQISTDFRIPMQNSRKKYPPFEPPSSPDSGISSTSFLSTHSGNSTVTRTRTLLETDFPAIADSRTFTHPCTIERTAAIRALLSSSLLPMMPLYPSSNTDKPDISKQEKVKPEIKAKPNIVKTKSTASVRPSISSKPPTGSKPKLGLSQSSSCEKLNKKNYERQNLSRTDENKITKEPVVKESIVINSLPRSNLFKRSSEIYHNTDFESEIKSMPFKTVDNLQEETFRIPQSLKQCNSLGRNESLLRSFTGSDDMLNIYRKTLQDDHHYQNKGELHHKLQQRLKSGQQQKQLRLQQEKLQEQLKAQEKKTVQQNEQRRHQQQKNPQEIERQSNQLKVNNLVRYDFRNSSTFCSDGVAEVNEDYSEVAGKHLSDTNHDTVYINQYASSAESVNSVSEKLKQLSKSNDLVHQLSANCEDDDQLFTNVIYSMHDKNSFPDLVDSEGNCNRSKSLRASKRRPYKTDSLKTNENFGASPPPTFSTFFEYPASAMAAGSCQTLPSRGRKGHRVRNSTSSRPISTTLINAINNSDLPEIDSALNNLTITNSNRANSGVTGVENDSSRIQKHSGLEESSMRRITGRLNTERLSEQELQQVELFYRSHKTEVLVSRCMADLYFGSARRHSASSTSYLAQYRRPVSSADTTTTAVQDLEDPARGLEIPEGWKHSARGIPLIILDSGDSRRERRLTFVLAERGTGFTLWKDTIDHLTQYQTSDTPHSFHTMNLSRDHTRLAGLRFLCPEDAESFYRGLESWISVDPNDPLLRLSRKGRLGWTFRSLRRIKRKRPSKADISAPCCFVHVTNLANMDNVTAFQQQLQPHPEK